MTSNSVKPIKIAHLCPQKSWGGAEIYAVDLADRQKNQGHETVVWATKDSPVHKHCLSLGIPVRTDVPLNRFNLFNLKKMRKAIEEDQITHLHLHWSKLVSSVFGIKWFVPVKVIFHLHIWPGHNKKDFFHKILYKQIDKVIVAGKNSARDLLLTHPISESQVALLPYGLDTHRFDNITDHRKKFSIQENDLFLGVFARIDRQKGIKELLLAIQSLISEGLSIKALFMGDKTIGDPDAVAYQNEIQEIMKDEVLQKNVTFKGFQRDYLGYVNSVDLMVLPSYKETYALTILDAFYLKKPVLSTNAGGTPELVSTERGWLALPKSTPSLAEKLKEIYAQKQTLQTKGQNAHDYICKNHVFSAVLTKLEEIYTQ